MRETQKDENNLGGKPERPVTEAPLLADHPALDLLNTVVRAEAGNVDELGKLVVANVQAINGITRTLTCPVVHI